MTTPPTQTTPYASAQDTASVIRPASADEVWLHAQLDRLDPHRLDAGGAGDTPALIELVFELRRDKCQLQGEAGVMRALLEESLGVFATLEPGDNDEYDRLVDFKKKIIAAVEAQLVHP